MLNEKEIAVYIEVARKPFTLKGFHVKGGFLLLKSSTGKTLGVSKRACGPAPPNGQKRQRAFIRSEY